MNRIRQSKSLRLVAAGMVAATLLSGCASSKQFARASRGVDQASAGQSQRQLSRGTAAAEEAVRRSPNDAAARSELGYAYLQAGRFQSAAVSFDDAMKLGDGTGRTALSLALVKVGAGLSADAVALLDDFRDTIPAADLGLAFALAGETGRGIAILTDAVRAGENTPKMRQNLAYAYALDGRWAEARLMAAQDVPIDQLDQRISDWALMGRPEDVQKRVATLLGVAIRNDDPGQPAALALKTSPAIEQRAAEAGAAQPETPAVASAELPPVDQPAAPAVAPALAFAAPPPAPPAALAETPAPAPVAAPTTVAAASTAEAATFAAAFSDQGYVTVPMAQSAQASAPTKPAAAKPAAAVRPVTTGGTHAVQLGSFSSPQGARRAWGIFAARNPELRDFRMQITHAVVRGKNFWRVAAAGFNGGSASQMCSSVKSRGGVCFAYANTAAPASGRPMPGRNVPGWMSGGPQKARR